MEGPKPAKSAKISASPEPPTTIQPITAFFNTNASTTPAMAITAATMTRMPQIFT